MKSTTYISKVLKEGGMSTAEFMAEWKKLDDSEKATMRAWARDECAVLGVELEAEPA